MSRPIKTTRSSKIDNAPTPHNTPASVLKDSYLRKKQHEQEQEQEQDDDSQYNESPSLSRINEKLEVLNIDEESEDAEFDEDDEEHGFEKLPKAVNNRILALKAIQSDLFELEKNFQLEMLELEQKYLQKYEPLHQHRFELIAGVKEASEAEIKKGGSLGEDGSADGDDEDNETEDYNLDIVGIPCFWLTAMENLPMVSQNLTERDCDVLTYLSNITLKYLTEGKPGFQLVFTFDKDNEFFSNETLTKTYYYQSELGYSGDFIYDHAEGEVIQWVDNDHNVTVTVERRKQKNKTTKQIRTIEKLTPVESFFNFFDPPKALDPENSDELDEEEVAELESRLAVDYAVGEEIKDKLIPRAVDWFTGAALEFEYGDVEDEEDEDEDDITSEFQDAEEDEDEEEEEEDDFANKDALKKVQPPECEQS